MEGLIPVEAPGVALRFGRGLCGGGGDDAGDGCADARRWVGDALRVVFAGGGNAACAGRGGDLRHIWHDGGPGADWPKVRGEWVRGDCAEPLRPSRAEICVRGARGPVIDTRERTRVRGYRTGARISGGAQR